MLSVKAFMSRVYFGISYLNKYKLAATGDCKVFENRLGIQKFDKDTWLFLMNLQKYFQSVKIGQCFEFSIRFYYFDIHKSTVRLLTYFSYVQNDETVLNAPVPDTFYFYK